MTTTTFWLFTPSHNWTPSYNCQIPSKGKIAGFVGNTQPGDTTPNLVMFDKEDTLFSQHSYPRIKWKEIMNHYSQKEYE